MKIAVNALSAQASGGISALIHLLPALEKRKREEDEYVVVLSPSQQEAAEAVPKGFKKEEIRRVPKNPYLRAVWEQLFFPLWLLRRRVDVLYSLGNITVVLASCRVVLFVENANPYSGLGLDRSFTMRVKYMLLRAVGFLSVRRADVVRFATENSKALLLGRLKIDERKCTVIPQGWDPRSVPAKGKRPHRRPYILAVSVVEVHKNLHNLVSAFRILCKSRGYEGDLLLAGNVLNHDYFNMLEKLVHESGLGSRVTFAGRILHGHIWDYYRYADLFVMPSVEETFGIPLVEAMGCGVPVAASDPDAPTLAGRAFVPFREICGDAAVYFDPYDPSDIEKKMGDVLSNENSRKMMIEKGKQRVSLYSWDNIAEKLINVFTAEK